MDHAPALTMDPMLGAGLLGLAYLLLAGLILFYVARAACHASRIERTTQQLRADFAEHLLDLRQRVYRVEQQLQQVNSTLSPGTPASRPDETQIV